MEVRFRTLKNHWNMRYFLLIPTLLLALYAQAQVIHVPSDQATIQAGLDAAQLGDTVLVAPGTYFENITWPAVNGIKLMAEGDTSNTFIDGNFEHRVIHIQGTGLDTLTEIIGFTIQHGRGIGTYSGSGIFCDSAGVVIRECRVRGNRGALGAGMCFRLSTSIVRNSLIDRNQFFSGIHAGGIGIFCSNSSVTISNSEIKNNDGGICQKVFGAGIRAGSSNLSLINCVISANTADVEQDGESRGIGISVSGGTLQMTNCLVTDNSSRTVCKFNSGTGLNMESGVSLTLENVTFSGNHSAAVKQWVSSIISVNSSASTLKGVAVEGNRLESESTINNIDYGMAHIAGTGLFIAQDLQIRDNVFQTTPGALNSQGMALRFQHGSVELNNLAIVNNKVSEPFDGSVFQSLVAFVGSGTASITNATIADNHGHSEGLASAIESESSPVTIKNSIIWNSSASSQIIGENISVSFSDILGGYEGEGNINADPNFIGDGDYRLQFPSPCIGTGTMDSAPTSDILGNPRPMPLGTDPDMGAYEDDHPFTSVNEHETQNSLGFYPNPTNGVVFIERGSGVRSVQAFNMQGGLVLETRPNSNNSIDLSGLPSGLYTLRLLTEDHSTATGRVVLVGR
jgi:hypothetical protein